MSRPAALLAGLCGLASLALPATAQSGDETLHLTVAVNPDGSKTIYQTDRAKRETVATNLGADGKTRGKTTYKLDGAGRYESGEIFGADGKLRMKTKYEYDVAGRLLSETQFSTGGEVRDKLIYSYDAAGHQSGYAVYDAAGRLLGRATPKPSLRPSR